MKEQILRDIAKDAGLKGDDALNYMYSNGLEVHRELDVNLLKRARAYKNSLRGN